MSEADIHRLITDFYDIITFKAGERPHYNTLLGMFDENAVLINNSFARPLRFTPEEFVQALQSQVAAGDMQQFMQREIYGKTELFGKVAQRISVYEYNFADHELERLPRGINFIQFVQIDGKWLITAMAWNDENENHIIPEEYLK